MSRRYSRSKVSRFVFRMALEKHEQAVSLLDEHVDAGVADRVSTR